MWEIARRLYLGDASSAHNREVLTGVGVTHILNCAREVPCVHRADFRYYHMKIGDPDPLFHEHIERLCKFIHRGRRAGGVLVHCAAGVSRSPSAILAYMCWRGKALNRALEYLQRRVQKTRGDCVFPDEIFLEQITAYFEEEV